MRTLLALLAVAAAALLVHARSVSYGFSHFDDDHLIVDRWEKIRDPAFLIEAFREPYFPRLVPNEGYYRPLVTASLMLDAAGREKPDPAPFHRTNVALHVLSCMLLLLVLRRLGAGELPSLALTLVYAVHPAFTMAVTWIPGRNDLLLAAFMLGAWLAYRPAMPVWRLALHLLLFGAALLTKELAIVLPALLLAQDWLLDDRRLDPRRDAPVWAGWIVAALAWGWLRSHAPVGADRVPLALRFEYFRDRLPALLIGLGKIVLPFDLAPLANQADSQRVWGWLALVLVAAALAFSRGRGRRLAALGSLVFLAFLLPTLPVSNTLLLENRLYLPAVGVALIAAAALARVPRAVLGTAAAVAILVLGLAQVRYGAVLKTPAAFADALLRTTPDVALAHSVAGDIWRENGDLARSEAAYRRSLEIDPRQWRIHNNLGVFALRRGDLAGAEREFRAELARDPDSDIAHDNLATTLWRMRRVDEAAAEWAIAVRLDPTVRARLETLIGAYARNGFAAQAEALRQALVAHGVGLAP